MAGPLEFECQVLYIPDTDQRLIIYCAEPGSPTEAAFRRLAEQQGSLLPRRLRAERGSACNGFCIARVPC